MDEVTRIAQAVLYEGYILWPYRRSAPKNRQRWTFGAVLPPAWSEQHPDDRCRLRSEVLVQGDASAAVASAPLVTAEVRFLHVVQRRVRAGAGAAGHWVDELQIGDERHLSWEEASAREVRLPCCALGELSDQTVVQAPIAIPSSSSIEPLTDEHGRRAGAIVRSWEALAGSVRLSAETLPIAKSTAGGEPFDGLYRVRLELDNRTPWEGDDRQLALRHALVSTHVVWRVPNGAFVSLTDPPDTLRAHAQACRNEGTWPVLVGEPDDRSTMLSAPIILEDHPRVAPESPGDMFDGGEIDQLLILNVLAMSEAERREMRDSDPRAREILERCAALDGDDLMRLHGTIREMGIGGWS